LSTTSITASTTLITTSIYQQQQNFGSDLKYLITFLQDKQLT